MTVAERIFNSFVAIKDQFNRKKLKMPTKKTFAKA